MTATRSTYVSLLDRLLADVDERLLGTSEGRREATRLNPALFALLYCGHHLRDHEGRVTFAEPHMEWAHLARRWAVPVARPQQDRFAFLAPRATGKSSWWFLLLPLWWAAHGHESFIAAFADSAPQAEMHLASFKNELDTNELLREDFPDLCAPGKRPSGANQADTKNMLISRSGFVFAAKGIDSSSLGMKVGARRPGTILLDDVEPDESSYSLYQAGKRLTTIRDAVLPLNVRARVVLSGTVTMPGSITHQLVKHNQGLTDDHLTWIAEEGFQVRHHLPVLRGDDGTERSMWPEKWPIAYLKAIEHTRSYKKNMLNDPMSADSDYWSEGDFTYRRIPVARAYLSVDGAVTTKAGSDYTGLSVVGWAPAQDGQPARCVVEFAQAVKLQGAPLRQRVLQILEAFPHIGAVLVETNQGGDLWHEILHDLPVRIVTVHNTEPKTSRAGRLLNLYQMIPTRVVHAERLTALEEQMVAFPKGPNDDLVDSVGNAVLRFLKPPARPKAAARSVSPR